MRIEQSVEDISDMFLKVYFILDAVPEEATSSVTVVSPALWDEYLQVSTDVYPPLVSGTHFVSMHRLSYVSLLVVEGICTML